MLEADQKILTVTTRISSSHFTTPIRSTLYSSPECNADDGLIKKSASHLTKRGTASDKCADIIGRTFGWRGNLCIEETGYHREKG